MAPDSYESISTALIGDVCARLAAGKRIRQALPGGGVLNIDRLLPFLCVYRRNPARLDKGTGTFVTSEASYLLAPGDAPVRGGMRALVQGIAKTAAEKLGSFLILEVWSGTAEDVPRDIDPTTGETLLPGPRFRILTRRPHRPEGTVATLEFALQRIKANRQAAQVEINLHASNHPPGMKELLSATEEEQIGCHVLGLEVRSIYRDQQSGEVYEKLLQILSRGVARALKKAFFAFALNRTNVRPQHYFSLGRSSLPQQVLTIDRQLAEVSGQFKFLLLVTPVNAERSWREFSQNGYAKPPAFQYRPLDSDPLLLKRRLMKIATERVEDPTLAHLLRQTQDELDRQVTMLSDIGTRKFLPGSLQVFGGVDASLLNLARDILARLAARDQTTTAESETVSASEFAQRATQEIEYYRQQSATFTAQAIVRDDIYSGLLVTGGNLLIGRENNLASRRIEALLQHEVGTHLVTYYNGASQPLRLLKVGLAGYDGFQEGLAVLAEYLVGGLTDARLKTIAARVIATESLIRGETLANSFSLLVDQYSFEPRTAYTIVLRVHRGGGLTKDAVYLRGLVEILDFVGKGGDLSALFVGKLAADHIPVIRELLMRGVLREPALRPRYMENPICLQRLQQLAQGATVLDLLEN